MDINETQKIEEKKYLKELPFKTFTKAEWNDPVKRKYIILYKIVLGCQAHKGKPGTLNHKRYTDARRYFWQVYHE